MASRAGELPMGPVGAGAAPSRRRPFTLTPPMLWIIASSSAALLAMYAACRIRPQRPKWTFRSTEWAADTFGSRLYLQMEVLGRHFVVYLSTSRRPPLLADRTPFRLHRPGPLGRQQPCRPHRADRGEHCGVPVQTARLIGLADRADAPPSRRPALVPVRSDLALGQINIVLTLMIVADLTTELSWRGRSFPHGLLVGLAAAVKFDPARVHPVPARQPANGEPPATPRSPSFW